MKRTDYVDTRPGAGYLHWSDYGSLFVGLGTRPLYVAAGYLSVFRDGAGLGAGWRWEPSA
jgi:GTPase